MKRLVQPELLDELASEDPLARHSRNDLQRLNTWMGNSRILSHHLQKVLGAPKAWRLLDLGAGDGQFMWQVAKRLPQEWKGTTLALLDKQCGISPLASHGLESLGWQVRSLCADANAWLQNAPINYWSAMCANLFLHHFTEEDLRRLLRLVSEHTGIFIAVEPRRSPMALAASRMVGLIGCNRVTRHDAVVSVRAGFIGNDLSQLWPKNGGWLLEERPAGLFSHLFVARRNGEHQFSF